MSAATCYPRSVAQCQGHRHYEYAPPQHARPLVAAPARAAARAAARQLTTTHCAEKGNPGRRPPPADRRPPPAEMLPPAHFYRCVGECGSFGVVLLLATRLIYGLSRARRLSRAATGLRRVNSTRRHRGPPRCYYNSTRCVPHTERVSPRFTTYVFALDIVLYLKRKGRKSFRSTIATLSSY
ncbi:hypothetical protein EVAR_4949_1 [Eumeta japonica]|uniref:Uncharacterized protein n=1 Tax=Eumeta variegata TaxID=151549 RepID=A0A4C1UYZ4_EUMVA|nr:hypothetical protein EVAR_4949_1 [Eumeta japonica]